MRRLISLLALTGALALSACSDSGLPTGPSTAGARAQLQDGQEPASNNGATRLRPQGQEPASNNGATRLRPQGQEPASNN